MASISQVQRETISLTRHILHEQVKSGTSGELTYLLASVQLACKQIATSIRKAGIAGLYGLEGVQNVQGEDVKKLDVVANNNFISACRGSKAAAVLVSEENDEPIVIDAKEAGKYVVSFDPLDVSWSWLTEAATTTATATAPFSSFTRHLATHLN